MNIPKAGESVQLIKKIHFTENLNKLMAARGLTLTQTAHQLGICKSSLHNYCNGVLPTTVVTIQKIADFFKVSLDVLLYGENFESLSIQILGEVEGEYIVTVKKRQ